MNMYGGGGGTGGAGGNTAGQSENVTFDVRASGIVAGDYNKGYATSDGLVMDLQALKELAAKVDPAAAKKATAYNQVLVKRRPQVRARSRITDQSVGLRDLLL